MPLPSFRWPSPRRRLSLPDDVRAALPLEPRERVLAAAERLDGGWAVATERALLLVPVGGAAGRSDEPVERIAWWTVDSAAWDDASERLVVDARPPGRRPLVRRLALTEPASSLLPETVRERVQASIVVSQKVRLLGRAGGRVTARQVPGTADLVWNVQLDPGLDPADPQVQAAAEAALAEVRAQTAT
ncbi:MAG: hypothetical protein ACTHOD_19675 [Motilibacteraceae bacterium]